MSELTRLFREARTGDASVRNVLFAEAYPVLENLAQSRLREAGGTSR